MFLFQSLMSDDTSPEGDLAWSPTQPHDVALRLMMKYKNQKHIN